jgi:hypothetical protein
MSALLLDSMQAYLEELAEKHTEIRHNVNGLRSFAWFQSEEHINQIQNAGGDKVVIVADYNGQRVGDYDDQKVRQVISVRFAVKSNGDDNTTAIKYAIQKAEEIMFDFVNKMQQDYETECGPLKNLEPEKISWNPFDGPWLDSFYGFDLDIPFKTYMPGFDSSKWIA